MALSRSPMAMTICIETHLGGGSFSHVGASMTLSLGVRVAAFQETRCIVKIRQCGSAQVISERNGARTRGKWKPMRLLRY
jgi:hypothetical protein